MKNYTEITIDLVNGECFTMYVPVMTQEQRMAEQTRLHETYSDIIASIGTSIVNENEIP